MKKIVLQAIGGIEDIYSEPAPEVVMVEMGDYGLKFNLQKAKIGIPYPTHIVHMKP